MIREAYIDGEYRYELYREWDFRKPMLTYIMLNPSTADGLEDDPTIRSCIRIAKHHGFGSFVVYNLFAFRATDPEELLTAADPVGPENDDCMTAIVKYPNGGPIVCAWGASRFARDRAPQVLARINQDEVDLRCLGTTRSGAPRHPLYCRTDTPLYEFP